MENLSALKSDSWLSWFLRGVLTLTFLFLFARLFELQIIKGGYFRALSEGNRVRRMPIPAPRGKIIARGGEVLVGNKEVRKRLVFKPDSGFEIIDDTPGSNGEIISEWVRFYPLGEKFAHASGYLGEVSEDEVGKIDPKCSEKGPRDVGTLVGRSGLEEEYNCRLSGVDGEELVEVDTAGHKIRTLGKKEPKAGEDIKTSIDFGLQEKVAGVMSGKKGAAIATDPNGEILAFYSTPSFDPNLFVEKDKDREIKSLLSNPELPFFNRAVGGLFHPGSVFKPLVAIAALEEGKIDKNYTFNDPGVIKIGKFSYSNWYFNQYGRTEGTIGLVRAIARSTDTFFYTIGELTGPEAIAEWANKFGLGSPSGIDIPGEIGGLIPTPEWKLKLKGEQWFLGNTYHFSIGQGDVALTPLGINSLTRVIADEGALCPPKILKSDNLPSCQKLPVERQNIDLVREGMRQACSPGGTGYTFFDFTSQVACKTGTAETSPEGEPHAWFTLFAPYDSPEIILTVLVEKGGEGSRIAGPLARDIMDYWQLSKNP